MTERTMREVITRRKPVETFNRFPSIEVHSTPVAQGISWDAWMFTQPLCTPRELEAHLVACRADKAAKLAQTVKPKSGALPHNTDWL